MFALSPKNLSQPAVWWVSGCVLAIAITGYYLGQHAMAENAQQSAAPPAPSVDITVVAPQQIRTWAEFSGRLAAVNSAEIKPLVGGTIQQVLFEEGELVNPGQPLFIIDPRPHAAAVKRAQAQLQSARVRAKLTQDEYARAEKLLRDKLVSQSLFDQAQSDQQMAKAAVSEAEAALVEAELSLDYAHIRAPVAGRIGRAELTVGNVVEAGANAPVLASIVSHHSLYAEFNVDEQTYIKFMRRTQTPSDMPVRLILDADRSMAYEGQLHAFDNHIDSTTGTIRARATFANTDGVLTPGMYAIVQLGSPFEVTALIIPERAIGTNQDKKFAYVVDANNVAQYRPLVLGDAWNGQRIIVEGLVVGDKVIVNGLSHVRPNMPVNPVESSASVAANP